MPHGIREQLATALGVPETAIRVVIGDVGGGFGLKNPLYPEYIALAWAAGRIGRPVRWIADRSEAFLADYHGRDNISRAAPALDEEGCFLGLRVSTLAGLGGCLAPKGPLSPTSNIPALSRPGQAEQMRSSSCSSSPCARTSPSDRPLGRPARLPVTAAVARIRFLDCRCAQILPKRARVWYIGLWCFGELGLAFRNVCFGCKNETMPMEIYAVPSTGHIWVR
jgi:hypothetical protein